MLPSMSLNKVLLLLLLLLSRELERPGLHVTYKLKQIKHEAPAVHINIKQCNATIHEMKGTLSFFLCRAYLASLGYS